MLQIITDSAADITLNEAKKMNIHIIPINIEFEDGSCPQETIEDFSLFYERLESTENLPKTSQPSPGQYQELFEKAKAAGDEVLVLTLSSGLSGTINTANLAKNLVDYEDIYIVDSRQAIAAQRLLVEYAVELRSQNMAVTHIIEKLESLRDRITVNGMIDTLTYLRKGGRIPQGLAMVGDALQIKPLIILEDKCLKMMGKARGREAGKRLIAKRFEKHKPDPEFPIYFVYSSDKELGREFMDFMIERFGLQNYRTRLVPVGGVIGTHVGTNGVGLAYVTE